MTPSSRKKNYANLNPIGRQLMEIRSTAALLTETTDLGYMEVARLIAGSVERLSFILKVDLGTVKGVAVIDKILAPEAEGSSDPEVLALLLSTSIIFERYRDHRSAKSDMRDTLTAAGKLDPAKEPDLSGVEIDPRFMAT